MKTIVSQLMPIISVFATLTLAACGPDIAPPNVPIPSNAYNSGDLSAESGGSGSDPETESHNETEIEKENENGTNPETQDDFSGSPLTDSTSKDRFASLPNALLKRVETCEKQGRFFDLALKVCTSQKRADLLCKIDKTFATRLDQSTLSSLADYLRGKAKGLQLYACTEDAENIILHFFSFSKNVVTYKELSVAKAE